MAKKDLDVAAEMLRLKVEKRSEVLEVGGDCDGLWIKCKPEADPASFPATCGGHRVYILRSSLPPGWVPAAICGFCGEAAHVYFCLKDPQYLADPEGFVKRRG